MEIVANWKQFLSPEQEITLAHDLLKAIPWSPMHTLTILPSALTTLTINHLVVPPNTSVTVGMQDISASLESAQTGNIRADHIPVDTILIGHSERARYNHETIADNLQKLTVALSLDKKVILCFGEKDKTSSGEELLATLKPLLAEYRQCITEEKMADITLAYEPQWSIGSTTTASSTIVKKVLALAQAFGFKKMLYGGSVDHTTIKHIYFPEIAGFLIGRASTNMQSLSLIFAALNELT